MNVEQRLAALETRCSSLEDLQGIQQLKARYLNACDRQDPEAVRECFVAGKIVIDMDHFGYCESRDDFVDGIFIPRGCHEHVLDMHHCANPEIELLGPDTARGVWSLNYSNINTQDSTLTLLSALYHDSYVKVAGDWKISASRTEYRTLLSCSYQPGTLQVQLAARSAASQS